MFRMVEGPSRLAGCWAPGIAESRLTSQPKAARHEWAPTTTTRLPHSDAYRALYPTTHSHSLHISQNQILAMPVWLWTQTSVSQQIREVCKFSEIIGRAASGVSDYVRCVHGRRILQEKVAGRGRWPPMGRRPAQDKFHVLPWGMRRTVGHCSGSQPARPGLASCFLA